MAQQTEAACLLETGTLYTRRLGLRAAPGHLVFAGFKQAAFSLYDNDAPIFHFDLEGRWQRAFVAGIHYLKGLDTTTQKIDRVREGKNMVLKRRTLSADETEAFDAQVRGIVLDWRAELDAGRFDRLKPPETAEPLSAEELRAMLDQIAQWDGPAWSAQRAAYRSTYGPLPFLPPDCLNAVVLQATVGDADGRTFGGSRPSEYSIHAPAAFEEHARAVAALLGRRVDQCKGLFLAGPDVLRRPVDDVAAYLATARRVFPQERLANVHAFLDDPSSPRPTRDDWQRFVAGGLRRVSLGVESGAPEVRALYGKRWGVDEFRALVADLKSAGLGVGVLVLVGAGGVELADRHVAATVELLGALELGPGDLISLLDAAELERLTGESEGGGTTLPVTPLNPADWTAQQAELKRRLTPIRAERGVKIAPYSLEKQGGA